MVARTMVSTVRSPASCSHPTCRSVSYPSVIRSDSLIEFGNDWLIDWLI
jgi:hypothetical protein